MREEQDPSRESRGEPLVATWARCVAATALFAAATVLVIEACLVVSHSSKSLALLWPMIGIGCGVLGALLWAILRAEELRLGRELRIARTGTPNLRAMVTRRRQQVPAVARLLSTRLGTAAVLLAEDERSDALAALGGGSPLMRGGRLERLRAIVDADAERASGTAAGLNSCLQRLRSMNRIGNREADLYRTHVLVKAVLEQGDADEALALVEPLEASSDEEERVYLAWLRVWFELDADVENADRPWPPLSEGELRMAVLLARAHGAEKLVDKLEGCLASIARSFERE